MEVPAWLEDAGKLVVTAVVGYVLGVVFGVNKLRVDLAFIKGQLSQVMSQLGRVDKLEERHAIIELDSTKTRKDLDAAHAAIRELRAPPSVQ